MILKWYSLIHSEFNSKWIEVASHFQVWAMNCEEFLCCVTLSTSHLYPPPLLPPPPWGRDCFWLYLFCSCKVECAIPKLKDCVLLFGLALRLCQQLKDKVKNYVLHMRACSHIDTLIHIHVCTNAHTLIQTHKHTYVHSYIALFPNLNSTFFAKQFSWQKGHFFSCNCNLFLSFSCRLACFLFWIVDHVMTCF